MFQRTFTVQLIGGSRDGDVIRSRLAPDFFEAQCGEGWVEVYERQNEKSPFLYRQVGYGKPAQVDMK
jgi:hypothetical protein